MRLAAIVVFVAACGPSLKFEAAPGGRPPAVERGKLVIIDRTHGAIQDLPAGVSVVENERTSDVVLAPDYPTRESPHRRVGDFRVEESALVANGSIAMAPDVQRQLADRAAAAGANLLVILTSHHAVAVRLSDAAAPRPPADQAIARLGASLEGYRPRSTETLTLDGRTPLTFEAARGRCLAGVFALEPDADWAPDMWRRGARVASHVETGWMSRTDDTATIVLQTGQSVPPRAATVDFGCALEDTRGTLRLTELNEAMRLTDGGVGHAKLALFEKTKPDDWITAERTIEMRSYMFDTRRPADFVAAERDCVVCAGSMGSCRDREIEACAPLQACLQDRHHDTRVGFCLREH